MLKENALKGLFKIVASREWIELEIEIQRRAKAGKDV